MIEFASNKHFKREWTQLRAVLSCRSSDVTRFTIMKIMVEDSENKSKYIATDGRRLHIRELGSYRCPSGIYEVVKNTPTSIVLYKFEDEGKYPKYQDVIPKEEDMTMIGSANDINELVYRVSKHGVMVSVDLAKALVDSEAQIYVRSNLDPIKIKYSNGLSVLMPLRLPDKEMDDLHDVSVSVTIVEKLG